ncbi:MAG: carboxyl transferase domain-containing protein [Burkholderiaceae bacterium]
MKRLLIANRGEIAIRIARAAAELGVQTVAVHAPEDEHSLHRQAADVSVALNGRGAAAYLDIDALVAVALAHGCDAVHPGYGFLSERSDFAQACERAGLTFIGPGPELLALFGDKARAREAAIAADVPVNPGINASVSLEQAQSFLRSLPEGQAAIIKALAGGGGRGTRVVRTESELSEAWSRCRSEAQAAFGIPDVYIEAFIEQARHIEVQVIGDRTGCIVHLGERECSLQRRFQKVIEIAPAPALGVEIRQAMHEAALRLATHAGYFSLGTFEFLLDAQTGRFVFIEANARLQVEHTVTEAVTGIDLVQAQIAVAQGRGLDELGLLEPGVAEPRGHAIQVRLNLESIDAEGRLRPGGGLISAYEPPSGPGVRVDGFGYAGYRTASAFDSLLAKLIVHHPSPRFSDALARTRRALQEFRIEGVTVNADLMRAVLEHPDLEAMAIHTRWIEARLPELVAAAQQPAVVRHARVTGPVAQTARTGHAGARVDTRDPLALFAHDAQVKAGITVAGRADAAAGVGDESSAGSRVGFSGEALLEGPEGSLGLPAPIQGTLVSVAVAEGDFVAPGQTVAIVEAMKMEHVIEAPQAGRIVLLTMAQGEVVREGWPVAFLEPQEGGAGEARRVQAIDPDHIRADLREVLDRHALTLDAQRPRAVARRKAAGYRMPRENIAELADPGTFKEYWPLIVAMQHQRHDPQTLRQETPADGVVAGTCSINGEFFDDSRSRAIIVHYDYTVLAGTQGRRNHYKQDRMFDLAQRFRLPVVLFGEGGGGRPGDDHVGPRVAFDTHTFTTYSKLSGLVPLVAIINGRTFAGNTALVACSDVIIATEGSTLGMGGPAMIEGGGLGVYTPEEVGPMSFQVPNGVVDLLVKDEAAAVQAARRYLSYFQGPIAHWEAHDQRSLRHVIPENRLRLYDMRTILHTLADKDSVLELREKFGVGIITAFIRVEGRPMGVIANNPHHLAGAVDSDGADKAARFMRLCDAFDIPLLSLMDCPGIMVGPDHERTALVRHSVRLFNVGANLSTPLFGVIVRKAYGLGVQAMCVASALVGFFTVAWPTAEFSGMNIEGAVKLGFRKELAAIPDAEDRRAEFDRRVQQAYDTAKAVNAAQGGGLDDVIDPAETRSWIAQSLRRLPPVPERTGKKHPFIDPW